MKNYGIIDIGSNSVRLLYNNKKYINVTQLSENLYKSGRLCAEAMRRTAAAVTEFNLLAKALGAEKVLAFATEAVRSAENSKEFIEILKDYDIDIEVLSADTEAAIGFYGAYNGEGTVAVLDIGGASTELIVGNKEQILYKKSLSYGSVRLRDAAEGKNWSEFKSFVNSAVKFYGNVPSFDKLIAIGGTATSIAAYALNIYPYEPKKIHNSILTYNIIEKSVENINVVPLSQREQITHIPQKRAEVIPYGGFLLVAVMNYLNLKLLTVSENDNLEGYLSLIKN